MILKNKVVVILGIAKFDGPFESTSYTVAKYLAKDNDVYYVDYPYTWKDYLTQKDDAFIKRKKLFSRNSNGLLKTHMERLQILIVPPVLSINFLKEGPLYRFLLNINEKIIAARIIKAIGRQRLKDAVYINSFNFHYPNLAEHFSPAFSLYHCVDPLILKHDRKHGVVSEKLAIENSDLIVCTSRQLCEEKKELNSETYFIPNAADLSHSSKAMQSDLAVNSKVSEIPKPIVGYFGNIERRIDYSLLLDVVSSNPAKSFVFAGPVQEAFVPQELKNFKNVYFIGRVPYEDMPSVIKAFDVAIIPFKKDGVSRTIFPLKLFEYLGAGKPVVATDFNLDLKEFTLDEVQYCSNSKQFSEAIEESIVNDSEARKESRIAVAAENNWDKRLGQFKSLIEEHFVE